MKDILHKATMFYFPKAYNEVLQQYASNNDEAYLVVLCMPSLKVGKSS